MTEDLLARTKFQQFIAARNTSLNASRDETRIYFKDRLVKALERYNPANVREYMFAPRKDV